ncbi:uncharacterized protein LOC132205153 [Neocloeon triangulifer]|uniref:uncharacterized protein LOC132205153 n=1 Tax=Neocloeon triangulifer TaxID=2078957 RepID=UPI00286EE2EE|nr:uncharacterized protein LOC132205153 [Neocloeon triangulifer]
MLMYTIFQLFYVTQADIEQQVCRAAFNYEKQDFTWRIGVKSFDCISRCDLLRRQFGDEFSRKPKFFMRVFTSTLPVINCLKEQRLITSICELKMRGIEMKQYADLPLVYFPVVVKLNKFKAEKFCQQYGLKFGIEESMPDLLTTGMEDVKIWTSDIDFKFASRNQSKAVGIICKIFHKQRGSAIFKNEDCKNENNFVCVLPDGCHANHCSSKCSNGQCGSDIKSIEKCESNCPKPECGEESQSKFGYKAIDGDLLEICGRQYLFSKAFTYSQKGASVFCCTKHMSLASVSGDLESKCLAREMIKRNYTDNSFWTGGRLGSCPNTYFWCPLDGTPEVVDQEALQWQPSSDPNKQAITLKAVTKANMVQLEFEDKDARRRVLCVREIPSKCTESICNPVGATQEINDNKKFRATAFYRRGCIYGFACKKIYDFALTDSKFNYYQAAKWSIANLEYKLRLVTFETKEKVECLLEALKASGISSSTFYVAANSFGCPKSIRWCNSADNPIMDDSFIQWEAGEPSMDPNKDCVYAKYNAGKNELTFGKTACNATLYFINESDAIYENNILLSNSTKT